jgi:UDP-3-O-[3-hydroxymyristoyl] glucosamine N-acyltransferase
MLKLKKSSIRYGYHIDMHNPIEPVEVSLILDAVKELNFSITSMKLNITGVYGFVAIDMTSDRSLSYLSDLKQLRVPFSDIKGLVLISESIFSQIPITELFCDYMVIDDPKYLFAYIHDKFGKLHINQLLNFSQRFPEESRNVHRYISEDARFGPNVILGIDLTIHGGVHVFDNTVIGDRVTIKPNSVIGGEGFGYATRTGYPPLKMPHFGSVHIGNDVEIGSSTNIDRGTFGITVIGNNVKIDNGVHIAHNVSIGARSLIIANSEISGSVTIGEDVWIAPNVSVREKIFIGDRAFVGIGSVVTRNVSADKTVYGVPAKEVN